jgi:hypothetical protein
MAIDPQLFEQAKTAFNSIRLLKGQTVAIATCDDSSHPNVAPIGSMRVIDDQTVYVLHGLLPRTVKNLEVNPRAAFSVTLPMNMKTLISMIRSGDNAPSGYRLYCEFEGFEDDKSAVSAAVQAIQSRLPFFLRGLFRKFCDKNLRRLMRFRILELRAT